MPSTLHNSSAPGMRSAVRIGCDLQPWP
jgi:hypothetical protein